MYGLKHDYDIGEVSPTLFQAMMYQMADKYIIPRLKIHSLNKFASLVKTSWVEDDFPTVISEVYSNTPQEDRGLRDLTLTTFCRHFAALENLKSFDDFKDVLRGIAQFSSDLVLSQRCKSRTERRRGRKGAHPSSGSGSVRRYLGS